MANELSQIGIEVETKTVRRASKDLDKMGMSAKRTEDKIEDLADEENRYQSTTKRFDSAVNKNKKSLDSYSASAGNATNKSKRFGQIAGQAGYQVGDFAVQVQGGQSALIAFSQQGSQLLGAFGAFGAIAGAVLAVSAALGGAFLRSSQEAKKGAKELDEQIKALTKNYRTLNSEQLNAVRAQAVKDLEKEKDITEQLQKDVDKLNKKYKSEETRLKNVVIQLNQWGDAESQLSGVQDLSADTREKLIKLEDDLAIARGKLNLQTQKQNELEVLSGNITEEANRTKDEAAKLDDLKNNALDRGLGLLNMQNEAMKEHNRILAEQDQQAKIVEDVTASLQLQTDMFRANASGNQESIEKTTAAWVEFQAAVQSEGLAGPNATAEQIEQVKQKLIELYEAQNMPRADKTISDDIDDLVMAQQQSIESFNAILDATASFADKIQKPMQEVSTAFGAFADLNAAFSANREAQLKRDLQNSEKFSEAEIKNKEKELKGIFEKNKKFQMAQIIANTAAGVTFQLATGNWVGAGAVAASGALQFAKLEATRFNSPSSVAGAQTEPPPASVQNNTSISSAPNVSFNINGNFDQSAVDQVIDYIKNDGVLFSQDSEQGRVIGNNY